MLPGLSRGAHPVGGWAPLPLAESCRADTPLASLRNVSRRRLTTDQPGRFVTPRWLTLILRCDRPVVGLSALRHAPPALGPMTMSTVPGPGIARTRAEAIELSRVRRPGLILADIQLADGSSGLEAVNDLLNSFEVPVIFISAHPERFLTGERPEPAFLTSKPYQQSTVSAVVSQALFFERNARQPKKRAIE